MIDQERQAKIKHGHFNISLHMPTKETLSIVVENTLTLSKYSQTIDREYISQQENFFQAVFQGALDIYDYLKTVINDIIVAEEKLFFDYKYGNNKVKRISIQLLKENIDRVQLAHLKADTMKEKFTAQLLQKDIEIQELKQKFEDQAQQFQHFRAELQVQKNKSIELAENLKALIHLVPLIPIVQDLKKGIHFSSIDHHPSNSHKTYFTLSYVNEKSMKINRIGDNGHYNFINKCVILPTQKFKYSVTINKTAQKRIMIGFCTQKGMGNVNNYDNAESAYYFCWSTGWLYQSGSGKQISTASGIGETVECEVDFTNCKMSWWKKGAQFLECSIPTQMRNKPIYISILIYDSGDEIDLCL